MDGGLVPQRVQPRVRVPDETLTEHVMRPELWWGRDAGAGHVTVLAGVTRSGC